MIIVYFGHPWANMKEVNFKKDEAVHMSYV